MKLIHRVPFSSGLSSGPGVSTDVEQMTRTAMEKLGNQFAGPIWVEMKFNWSHGHSTPKLVKVHGGALGDTYFKPVPSNYKIIWLVRNEDFFALRWGRAGFHPRAHRAAMAAQDVRRRLLRRAPRPTFPRSTTSPRARSRSLGSGRSSASGCSTNSGAACSTIRRHRTRCSRRSSSTIRRGGATICCRRTRWRRPRSCASPRCTTRSGISLCTAKASWRCRASSTHYIGVDALIGHPTMDPAYVSVADYVKTLQLGGIVRRRSHHAAEAHRAARTRQSRGTAPRREASTRPATRRCGMKWRMSQPGPISDCTSRRNCAAQWRWKRFVQSGGPQYQQQAIEHLQRALGLLGRGDPHHASDLQRHARSRATTATRSTRTRTTCFIGR